MKPAYALSTTRAAYLEELVAMRECRGLSRAALASSLDMSEEDVAAGEAGERRIDVLELQRWVFACGSTLTTFMSKLDDRVGRAPSRRH